MGEAPYLALTIPEIITHVLMFAPVDSLWRMCCVSKNWLTAANRVWHYIGLRNLIINLEQHYESSSVVC
jgi:hypothetical protein